MKRANARNYGHEVKGYIIANGMTLTCMAAQLAENVPGGAAVCRTCPVNCVAALSVILKLSRLLIFSAMISYGRKGSVDNSRDLRICPSFNERTE